MKYHIIPNLEKLDLYQALAKEYNLGFEYNDFFYGQGNWKRETVTMLFIYAEQLSILREANTCHSYLPPSLRNRSAVTELSK